MAPRRTLRTWLLLPVLCLLGPGPLAAAVVEASSVEALTRRADRVVAGRVVARRFVEVDEGRRLFTILRISVKETLKGEETPEVELVLPGGESGDLAQVVSGLPRFEVEDEVVLFLMRRPGRRATWQLTSLGLGAFRIRGAFAERWTDGLEVVTGPLDVPTAKVPDRSLPVEDLRRRIQSAAAEGP